MGRALILAALSWLILAGANPPQQQANAQRGTEKAQPAPASQPSPSPHPSYRPYPDPYSERCYQAQDHDTADLCAQWRAALSSEKAAHEARRATNWSIIATFLSLLGVAGLLYTLRQTHDALQEARRGNVLNMRESARTTRRAIASGKETQAALTTAARNADAVQEQANITKRALKEARRTADAMADQVKVSKDAADKQLRAYVGVNAANYTIQINPDGTGGFGSGLEVMNFGQTPAYQYRHIGTLNLRSFPSDMPDPGLPQGATHTLFPGMKTYINMGLPLSVEEVRELQAGAIGFYIQAVAEYFDHAGERHVQKIRYVAHTSAFAMTFTETVTGTLTFHSGEDD